MFIARVRAQHLCQAELAFAHAVCVRLRHHVSCCTIYSFITSGELLDIALITDAYELCTVTDDPSGMLAKMLIRITTLYTTLSLMACKYTTLMFAHKMCETSY